MFLAIASTCFVSAACCFFGLEIGNLRQGWWPSGTWADHYVVQGHVPTAAKRVYFLNSILISIGFVALAFWASHYEKLIGRLPLLTAMCFFIAFINASIAAILAGRVEPAGKPTVNAVAFQRNEDRRRTR